MIAFIIPVMSKTVSSNWTSFSKLLNRSINSICNQKDSNFKVIIVCHEIPKTDFNNDPRVEFLTVNFAPPVLEKDSSNRWVKEADKGKKLKHGAVYAQKIDAKYIMTVDADDCISNKISAFVNKNNDDSITGWYVKKGYLYIEGKQYSFLNNKNFNTICGTCVIIKPNFMTLMYGDNFWFNHEITHLSNGKSLSPLPFPGSVYSMLNGSNFVLDKKGMKERTKTNLFSLKSIDTIIRRIKKYRIVPLLFIKKEFSIYQVKN